MGRNDQTEKGKKPAAGQPGKMEVRDNADFVGYINVNLTETQKAGYGRWAETGSLWEVFDGSVSAGVNISVKRSLKEGCFIASATQRDETSVNAGLCSTARGSSPLLALGRLLYILTYLNDAPQWTDVQAVANPDRW